MKDYRSIEDLLGQSEIMYAITRDYRFSAKYLIAAPAGGGKHYLINQLKDFFGHQSEFKILHCRVNRSEIDANLDFTPFIEMLSREENVAQENYFSVGKTFVELIPYIGKCVSQLMSQKKVYPVIFNSTESELLARIEHVIGGKKSVFLCEEIDYWDGASIRFLEKLMSSAFPSKVCIFICTITGREMAIPVENKNFDQCFRLHFIPEEQMKTVTQILFPGTVFPSETLQQIYHLSGGNIGIILQLVNLIQKNDISAVSEHQAYRDIILHRLQETLGQLRYENAVELLDRASLIGERVYKKMLEYFVHFDPATLTESIDDVVRHDILMEEIDFLTFSYHIVWQSFYDSNNKNRHFHYELAKCICQLMPSNYSYIADEMLKAGKNREAAIYYILSAIKEYHTYRSLPVLPKFQIELLQECKLYTDYQNLLRLYSCTFAGNYEDAQKIICRYAEPQLLFEADYIRAVGKINGSIMQSTYAEALTTLQSWIEDEDFRQQSPYQWMRAAILAIGAQYELHDQSMFDLLKKIDQTKRKYASTDQGIEWLDNDFLSKCNYCYTIDTAYYYTKEALDFFRKNLTHSPSKYPYYIALINCGANSIVLGKYQEAIDFLTEALALAPILHKSVDSLINNLLIAELLGGQMQETEKIQLAIGQMDILIQTTSDDIISNILLRNNQIVMLCYKGDIAAATEKIETLYNEIRYMTGVDDYYPYFVGNNYHIIRYLAGIEPINRTALEEIFRFRPLDHDHDYFAARQRVMLELLEHGHFPDLSASNWNNLPGPLVGPAWNFWGKWLLFSDLQIWSD